MLSETYQDFIKIYNRKKGFQQRQTEAT